MLYKNILKALAVNEMINHKKNGEIKEDIKEDFKEDYKDSSTIDSRIWRTIGDKSREINKVVFSEKGFDMKKLLQIFSNILS